MLKRLLIAVFVLGLVLALNGTAISDVVRGELNPVIKVNQNNQRFVDIADARPEQPTFKKPATALEERLLPPGTTAPSPPATYFCDVQDYTSGTLGYYWPIPDAFGDDLFNMRFTSDAGYHCTTFAAHYMMYGAVMTGTPDMRCYLWDDDGFGFPNNKLDSVDIPYATLLANTVPLGYVTATFATGWEFSNGAEGHLGWTPLQLGGPGDTLAVISDIADGPYAGEERSSEFWSGLWGTILNDWGIDVSFYILNDRCCGEIPFSDCYWQYYYTNIAYFWRAPHPVWGDEDYAMRMSVAGPETLMVVDVAIYDPGDGSFGNDSVFVTVYGDDGGGLPDETNQIAQVGFGPGGYASFPAWTTFDFTSLNLVMTSDFHIGFSSNAVTGVDWESCLSSDGTDGVGRSSSDWGGGFWVDMLSGWGLDVNFLFDAYMCRDEFSICQWNWCYNGVAYFWRLPDAWGDVAQAQKFNTVGFDECRVEDVCWYLYYNGTPNSYTTNSEVQIWSDAGGLPGTKLAGITLTPADYNFFPSATCVDFTSANITINGDYWVAIESFGTDSTDGIRTLSDDVFVGGGGCVDSWAEYWGIWALMWQDWGFPATDAAAVVDVYTCCVPPSGVICAPGEDWPTYQHDYARTGHSHNAVGDAWCDLTCNWTYEDPAWGVLFAGPITAYGRVACSFTQYIKVFDLLNGTLLYTYDPTDQIPAGGIRCTPTVAVVGGDTLMFVSGGSNEEVHAVDFPSGVKVWDRDIFDGIWGNTRWGRYTIVDVGGTDVLYWGTDNGYVVAAVAATGALYGGWTTNPVSLGLATWVSGCTDGTSLYFSTYGTGVEGDVYSIDAATGTINWALSSAGGLQGVNVWTHTNGYFGDEGFTAGLSYENGALFANSRAEADYPTDGLFYSLNAATGAVNYATLGNRAFYSTPIIDAVNVYMPTLTRWASPPAGGNLYAVAKVGGVIAWAVSSASGGRYYVDGVLTCEPEPDPDFVYAFNEDGFLSCFNSIDGDEIYRRRIFNISGYAPNIGMAGSIAPDEFGETHLTFGTYWGNLIDMTKQVDRPRLEIQSYNPTTSVEFGTNASLIVTIEDMFVNTGCDVLNFITVTADELPFVPDIPDFSAGYLDPNLMTEAEKIADKIARQDYSLFFKMQEDRSSLDESIVSVRDLEFAKETINRAAAGFPPYLNSVVFPTGGSTINAGDTADLVLDVIQTAINRGPQIFYIEMETDDPDFFIQHCQSPTLPQMRVTLVGGCLIDTTTLHFGMGGCPNIQLVTNTGRIGTGDWDPHAFEIDGDGSDYYQGAYVYGISTHRIATHTQDWLSGGGEADAFVSMQPDPNWCDTTACKPTLLAGVGPLGEYTDNCGQSYTALTGDMVCKSFIDSVQNFDLGGGWDWENFGAPFDNDSTMGLYVRGRVIGVCDIPELSSVTLEILDFEERNGDSVNGWYFGEIYDCDNGNDTVAIDRDISAAWTYNQVVPDQAWGHVKIPFGCGHEPLLNTWGTYGQSGSPGHGFWGWGIWWDSCYTFMTAGTGVFNDGPGGMNTGDAEALVTFASHDFEPSGTYSIGIAHFGLHNLADASDPATYAPLAHFVNKWAGWGRGDVTDDNEINLVDIIYLAGYVNFGGDGPAPFKHLGDVNASGIVDIDDVNYLVNYYFNCGPCPMGAWIF